MTEVKTDVAIVGAGIVGVATAYYLSVKHGFSDITIVDRCQPMEFTSAQSGENYRNWWPHPTMVAFTNRSIDLMEEIATESGNRINMNRRGYALSTRESNIDPLIEQLHDGLEETAADLLRYHEGATSTSYQTFESAEWETAPIGVDILRNPALIRTHFPFYDPEVQTILHIRRGGDISGQQLGMFMLGKLRPQGCQRITGEVKGISQDGAYTLEIATDDGTQILRANKLINAAGPFAGDIAKMLGVDLPIFNTLQQKMAFEDTRGAIPRRMPFSIDLDGQHINWSEEEREMLLEEPELKWLAAAMPGAIHCRPDGGDSGRWVKLGWAYNDRPADVSWEPQLDDNYPEIVLRGASRLNPALKPYIDEMPSKMHHYGGWYTLTEENWPLIGPMKVEGAFMNCAHSGFGTMAACAAGELCADWIANAPKPGYAKELSLARYEDPLFMRKLHASNRGIL